MLRSSPQVILVLEGDHNLRNEITSVLQKEGYVVLAVADGTIAVELARDNAISLSVLDVNQVYPHGATFCHDLRSLPHTQHAPILMMVTHEDEITTMIHAGWEVDDYIKKPLVREELRACVQTLLRNERRRRKPRPVRIIPEPATEQALEKKPTLLIEDLCIDIAGRRVLRQGTPIKIGSAILFDLLVYLACHRGIVLTKDDLLRQVWHYDAQSVKAAHSRTVSVHVHWLRELLGDDLDHPHLIQTVRGVGYRFKD